MADIEFPRSECAQSLAVDESGVRQSVPCPKCSKQITTPLQSAAHPGHTSSTKSANSDPLDKGPGDAFNLNDEDLVDPIFVNKEQLGRVAKEAINEFRLLDYRFLVPLEKIFTASFLRKKAVQWVLIFGLAPLVLFSLASDLGLNDRSVLWLVEVYFCVFWAMYFHALIQPPRATWIRGFGYAWFTIVAGLPVAAATEGLLMNLTGRADEAFGFPVMFPILTIAVGLPEELCKAMPLLIFGLRGNNIASVREGLFLGLMSGLGFASAEGVGYVAKAYEYGTASDLFLSVFDRSIAGPLMHGAWAGIVGWFIGMAARGKGKKWPIVALGIGMTSLLHGAFDTFGENVVGIGIVAFTYLLFLAYLTHGDENNTAVRSAAK